MNQICVSAPGKLILFGEHAVVYGQPCIVTAIDKRLTIEIQPADSLVLDTGKMLDTRFLNAAIKKFEQHTNVQVKNVRLTSSSSFSGTYGFGSSAAVTVATLKALSAFYQQTIPKEELFTLAYKAVLEVQKIGSGVDVAAAVWGGTLFYQKDQKPMPILVNYAPITFIVCYSGMKADTVSIVKQVEKLKQNEVLEKMGTLTYKAKLVLATGDWKQVGQLMNENQTYLSQLGVSSEKLDTLIAAAKTNGALGAKLSGAGGGDCIIALVEHNKTEKVKQALQAVGGEIVPVAFGATGI